MNVLWIEDFGGGLAASENTVTELFGGLINNTLIDDNWDPDENLIDNSGYLTEFFTEYSQLHKVFLCKNFFEFNKFYRSNTIIKDIDIIIIDIRLDNNINKNNILLPKNYTDDQNDFNLNAGFYIFNQLLQSGYPKNYMCLLTGEKNSYDEFRINCRKLYLQEPTAFEKDEDGYQAIRNWIDEKRQSKRLQLKRGILDGVKECKKNLTEPFEFINYIDDKYTEEKETINSIYIESYLNSIENNINNIYFDNTEIVKSLTLLIRAITHEWDNKIDDRSSPFVYILKKVRNMIAHNDKLEIWTEEDVALLFIISMRHIINYKLHPEIFSYEAKLLSLIRQSENLSRKSIKSAIKEDIKLFKQLTIDNNISFIHYNGSRNTALEQILNNTTLDSTILKERIYKVLWNHFDNYKNDTPRGSQAINNVIAKSDNDFKVQLFSAMVEMYERDERD